MTSFDLAALLLTLAAAFGWINARFIGLTHTTGLLVLGLAASLLLALLAAAFPGEARITALRTALLQIDFTDVVLNGMLAFLIFASALNLDLARLRRRGWPIAALALIGTTLSTALVGTAIAWASAALGQPLPFAWALVFGALISPTDPVAVLATLRTVTIPPDLRIEMQGEALFNDGVGIVLFTVLLAIAAGGSPSAPVDMLSVALSFAQQAGGGLLLGVVAGYLGYRAIRLLDDRQVEVLITLAVVTGSYAAARRLGASGPLAMVAAGLLIGDRAPRGAMSERTQGYMTALWTLLDDILNSVLFLLIGLEVLVLHFRSGGLLVAAAAIPIALLARLISVALPLLLFPARIGLSLTNLPFLTWAGTRGGISVALALSLPDNPSRSTIIAATYAVVLFTIVVQGGTVGTVARRTLKLESIQRS
jgi:CPA1 family monovalent cation:H+ antiporter